MDCRRFTTVWMHRWELNVRAISLREAWQDTVLLSMIVALSALPHINSMGFHSDDWDFLRLFTFSPDQSLAGLVGQFWEERSHAPVRPVQIVLYPLLYAFFGVNPLGYQIALVLVQIAIAVLFYLVLRELSISRLTALSIPLVFITLPHAGTTRFWFSSIIYPAGLALYFLGTLAELRALRTPGRVSWAWKILAVLSMLLSALAIELVIPLIAMNIAIMAIYAARRGRRRGSTDPHNSGRSILFVAISACALAAVIAYKLILTERFGVAGSYLEHLLSMVNGIGRLYILNHGFGLPLSAAWSIPRLSMPGVIVPVLIAVLVYVYIGSTLRHSRHGILTRNGAGIALAIGLTILVLGFAVFLSTDNIDFTSTGVSNRTTLVGTVGAAIILTTLSAWLVTWLPWTGLRKRIYAAVIGLLVVCGLLVNNVVAVYWSDAWERQQQVRVQISQRVDLAGGTTLLLDGVCPYVGPGIVFESRWDLAGALQIDANDTRINADIIHRPVEIMSEGLMLKFYGDRTLYHYGDHLVLFNVADLKTFKLTDELAARRVLTRPSSNAQNDCLGTPGYGEPILPVDIIFAPQ